MAAVHQAYEKNSYIFSGGGGGGESWLASGFETHLQKK